MKCITWLLTRRFFYSPVIRDTIIDKTTLDLAEGILAGKRHSLAKSITLVESSKPSHMKQAASLLNYLSEKKTIRQMTFRIGIAGPPGAGKSTFIDSMGRTILSKPNNKDRIAVIPIDPSSHISGGSILGDNTRSEFAYVRASPTRGVLGGIAEHTTDVITLCEAAGFNIVLVESVGLGQSEVDIDRAVDMMILLLAEAADMIVVNKCDGDLETSAQHTAADYAGSLQFIKRKYNNSNNDNNDLKPKVFMVSSLTGKNISELINEIYNYYNLMSNSGEIIKKRNTQSKFWMREQIKRIIISKIMNDQTIQQSIEDCDKLLDNNKLNPRSAANSIIDLVNIKISKEDKLIKK